MASGITITTSEGAARPIAAGSSKPLIIAPCSSGVKENTIYTFSSPKTVNDTIGYGNAALAAQLYMAKAPSGFNSVDVIVASGSIPGIITAVSTTSPTITPTGTPNFSMDLRVRISTTGTATTCRFQYSLDGGDNYTQELRPTSAGTYVIPNTGITVTFAAGTHTAGNAMQYRIQGPGMNASDLSNCLTTLATVNTSWTNMLVGDDQISPVSCAALFATLDAGLTTLKNTQHKFTQAILNCGGETYAKNPTVPGTAGLNNSTSVLQAITGSAASTGNFISTVAERASMVIPVTQLGYATPRLPYAFYFGARAHAVGTDISKNPAQDSFSDVTEVSYDEFKNGFVYSPEKVVCPRTFSGETGITMDEAYLKSAQTSTFDIWPKARITSRASEVMKLALRPFLHTRVRTLTDGTGRIDAVDKATIEAAVNKALNAALINTQNGQGFQGHVTAFRFTVSDANNVLLTKNIDCTLEIVPFAYPSTISAIISLTDTVAVTV